MHTLRQIERLWGQGRFTHLFNDLVTLRVEHAFAAHLQAHHPAVAAAAMAMIRLDELSQSHVQLHASLLRTLLGSQESDGGWGDPMFTSLCLRALLMNSGAGDAVSRGLNYLAALQQPAGIWPRLPFRRLPGDPLTTAFILSQLANEPAFRAAVEFEAATTWFADHFSSLDAQTRKLWNRVSIRSAQWRIPAEVEHGRLLMLWN